MARPLRGGEGVKAGPLRKKIFFLNLFLTKKQVPRGGGRIRPYWPGHNKKTFFAASPIPEFIVIPSLRFIGLMHFLCTYIESL